MTAADFATAIQAQSATATPMISDEPPMQECAYNASDISTVYTYQGSHDLLASSLYPTSATDLFTKNETQKQNAQARGQGKIETFSEGPFQALGSVEPAPKGVGIDSSVLFGNNAAARVLGNGGAPVRLLTQEPESEASIYLRILEGASGKLVNQFWCVGLMPAWLKHALGGNRTDSLSDEQTAAAYSDAKKKLIDWCLAATKSGFEDE